MTHYREHDPIMQGLYYTRHVEAMTAEGLHSKGAIASELAARDIQIDTLATDKADLLRVLGVADARAKALEADRDQISLTLAVAKADRDKWFNRARELEATLFAAQQAVITEGLARDKAQAALRPLAMAAKSWHDFHHDAAGYSAVQCDEICKALPLALAALSQSETGAEPK